MNPEVEKALSAASDELGLKDYYRDCVRPLLGTTGDAWPRCCGGQCEPCAEQLCAVARRVHEILGTPEEAVAAKPGTERPFKAR